MRGDNELGLICIWPDLTVTQKRADWWENESVKGTFLGDFCEGLWGSCQEPKVCFRLIQYPT